MITINDREIKYFFDKLSPKEMKKVNRTALRKSAAILVRATRALLRRTGVAVNKPDKRGKTMLQGIKYSIARDNSEAKVHIMGHSLLRIFEKGAANRKTKKSYNRGSIKSFYFFRTAQEQQQTKIFDNINQERQKCIGKLLSK